MLQGDEESPPPTATTVEATIPPMLGGLPLVEAITGNEGVAQVSLMHGKDMGLMRGYIAVWVAVDSAAAQEVVHDTLRLFP